MAASWRHADYLMAIAIFANAAKGTSALQIGRDLGVSYKITFFSASRSVGTPGLITAGRRRRAPFYIRSDPPRGWFSIPIGAARDQCRLRVSRPPPSTSRRPPEASALPLLPLFQTTTVHLLPFQFFPSFIKFSLLAGTLRTVIQRGRGRDRRRSLSAMFKIFSTRERSSEPFLASGLITATSTC